MVALSESAGVIIQMMPEASEKAIQAVETLSKDLKPLKELMRESSDVSEFVANIFKGIDEEFKPGRLGWHIKDTAITEYYFGPQYDVHGGGLDLIFPYHEAEITQMEAVSGKSPMVKFWLHTGFLNVSGEKMSKSLNNFTQ